MQRFWTLYWHRWRKRRKAWALRWNLSWHGCTRTSATSRGGRRARTGRLIDCSHKTGSRKQALSPTWPSLTQQSRKLVLTSRPKARRARAANRAVRRLQRCASARSGRRGLSSSQTGCSPETGVEHGLMCLHGAQAAAQVPVPPAHQVRTTRQRAAKLQATSGPASSTRRRAIELSLKHGSPEWATRGSSASSLMRTRRCRRRATSLLGSSSPSSTEQRAFDTRPDSRRRSYPSIESLFMKGG